MNVNEKIKKVKACKSIEDLEALDIGALIYDISYRGGNLGFYGSDVADCAGVPEEYLPPKYGAFCNYLGGGLRGAVSFSGYNKAVKGKAAEFLDELAKACKRAYIHAENEGGLNDEVDSDGETNWDAVGTNKSRQAGVVSAY